MTADQDGQHNPGRYSGRQRPEPTPFDEPGHARGQRRSDEPLTSQRAGWYVGSGCSSRLPVLTVNSAPGYQAAVCTEGNIYVLRYRADSDEPLRTGGLAIRAWHGTGLCR